MAKAKKTKKPIKNAVKKSVKTNIKKAVVENNEKIPLNTAVKVQEKESKDMNCDNKLSTCCNKESCSCCNKECCYQVWMCKSKCIQFIHCFFKPMLQLVIRLFMANIFLKSGLTKIESWDKTLWLYNNEYKIKFMSVDVAAFLSTAIELACPVLLILGLATRFSSLVLIGMTLFIEFTYVNNIEHYYWVILLSVLFIYGPQKISLDYYLKKMLCKCEDKSKK
jgi:putative oxidoreductase